MPQSAEVLGLCVSKVYQLLRSGRLLSLRIDGSRRISEMALSSFIRDQEARMRAELRGEVIA